jgi:hypothetical protein
MGSHPINLALRFLLEMAALVSAGIWGWNQSDAWVQYVLAIGIPIILAIIWGTFAVPGDPSRSGKTLIATPGVLRLLIELSVFAFASWSLYDTGFNKVSLVFSAIVLIHYILSYDRIKWLMAN